MRRNGRASSGNASCRTFSRRRSVSSISIAGVAGSKSAGKARERVAVDITGNYLGSMIPRPFPYPDTVQRSGPQPIVTAVAREPAARLRAVLVRRRIVLDSLPGAIRVEDGP